MHHPPPYIRSEPAVTISIDVRHSGPTQIYSLTPRYSIPTTNPPITITGSGDSTTIDLSGLDSPAALIFNLIPGVSGIPYTFKDNVRDTISTDPGGAATPQPWTGPNGQYVNIGPVGSTSLYVCYANSLRISPTSKFQLTVVGPNAAGSDPQIKNGSTTKGQLTPFCMYQTPVVYERERDHRRRHRHHTPYR